MLGKVTPELNELLRDAKRLTIVSGPSGVGKSTLTQRIRTDPSVQAKFGLDGTLSWISNPGLWEGLYESRTRQMFLTYNHNRLWMRKVGTFDQDDILRELRIQDRVLVVTMWVEPEILLRRCHTRIRSTLRTLARFKRVRKHLYRLLVQLRMRALYRKPHLVWQQYRQWLEFCDACNVSEHWTLRGTDPTDMVRWSGRPEPLWNQSR